MPGCVRHRPDGLGQRRVRGTVDRPGRRADHRGRDRGAAGAGAQAAALPPLRGPRSRSGRQRVLAPGRCPARRHRRAARGGRTGPTRRDGGDRAAGGRGRGRAVKILFEGIDEPGLATLDGYRRRGGYEALAKALRMSREDVLDQIISSGIRGRGGAGFQMGKKASFLPHGNMDKYLTCNADESEPGTFKDRELMQKNPHMLIEGIVIATYAAEITRAFIYIRGEYELQADILEAAIAEAAEAGLVGERILGSDHTMSLVLHRGAGAYICGEETALLDSLEGKRGNPRLKPPFPAIEGLYHGPTLINNVETLCAVPHIIRMGGEEYAKIG